MSSALSAKPWQTAGAIISVILAIGGATAATYRYASDDGASKATIRTAVEQHGRELDNHEERVRDLERKADVSIKDRADIAKKLEELRVDLRSDRDRNDTKLDKIIERLPPVKR